MSGPAFHLDAADLVALETQLSVLGWLGAEERVLEAGKAGEGNMNYTLRVRTTQRSVIVKQSRGWVEKYPQIAAPAGRILVEGAFYRTVSGFGRLASRMPKLLGFDAQSRLLMLEDVAPAPDFTFVYEGGGATREELSALVEYLDELHGLGTDEPIFENRDMRRLNHEHIFDFPLRQGNGLDLDGITPGLSAVASELKSDARFVDRVLALGERYLGRGPSLLHGDYFPGSWLKTENGPKVIDPEFCFYGPPEFDLGVMTAHLRMSDLEFDPASVYGRACDVRLVNQFAGVEIMRRLIGVAQLPLRRGLEDKVRLLREARRLVLA